ncbi:hypothetical protein BO221_14090 [Archangium sp. Cb G35]|uniref:hypothetical protein n=1 Tax=Archangium sp. Cb G35 TaxID=1920190 RepID=UPI000935C22E|nr:hypothetical protein [Archangium sp. Cb G35]OJT24302.1 hypothetical protein BO221_14090 [Archangium sp. Cb G35]
MKSSTRAHVRTAAMLAATSTYSEPEAHQTAARQAEPAAASPSPLEAEFGLTDLVRFGRELAAELKRIREEYPPAAPLKSELLEFGEKMKFRQADIENRLDALERKMEELQAWTQQQLAGAGATAEFQEELQRIRADYPTAKDVENTLTEYFGHPSGRVTRLEGRVGGMDERMTELALRVQKLEDGAATPTRSSTGKKPSSK